MHTEKVSVLGVRHIQLAFMFLLTTLGYATRANLSLAIVAMTKQTSENPNIPIYDWDTKSLIMSSFFWTYFALQINAGHLSRKYGAKLLLISAVFVNSLGCMLTPVMATYGTYGVIICRVVQGLSQGFFYPVIFNILAAWSPMLERGTMASIVMAGGSFGTIISTPFVGFISASWIGWPASFYILGSLGLAWITLYFFFGADSPRKHRSITESEVAYIEAGESSDDTNRDNAVPWKAIFTSKPFWAIMVAYLGDSWSASIIFNEIPIYIDKVIKFNIESNGLLSAAPYILCLIIGFGVGPLSTFMIKKGWITLLGVRKLFTILGCAVPAVPLILLGYIPEDQKALSVILLIIAIGFSSFANAGMLMNHLDIAPNHAGLLVGITNSATCALIPFPALVIQYTITNEEDKSQWRTHFITAAVLLIASTIFYVIYAAANVQWWNSSDIEVDEKKDSKIDIRNNI